MTTIVVNEGIRHARGRYGRNKVLGAVVPPHIYALAQEQARLDGVSVSHMCAKLIVKYLRRRGTTIQA